jgi:hypothetical protein
VFSPTQEARLVDLIVRDGGNTQWAGGVQLGAAKSYLIGSTILDITSGNAYGHVYVENTNATIVNTLIWAQSGTMLANSGSTLVTNYSLAKGQTLTGTGNLAGSVDPKLRSDAHLRASSPLRGAGGPTAQSRVDMDRETRPSSAPDIGADQYVDSDADGLPDVGEMAMVGSPTSLVGSADADGDGLSNAAEYDLETDWLDPDTDNDGLYDGEEVTLGLNPFVADADDLPGDANGDGVIDSIGVQLGRQPSATDSDGDGVTNADELLMCTDPLRSDTDGDGVPDNTDVFPRDPLMSVLPSDPGDVTAPVITLTAPSYAVLQ